MPLLALLHRALLTALSTGVLSGVDGRLRLLLAVTEPLILSALLVWVCLTLRRGLLKIHAGWLFEPPRRVTGLGRTS
jgi:hypothetical protein